MVGPMETVAPAMEKVALSGDLPHGPFPEAPVFRPSAEEFDDPMAFISKIRHLAESAGMCRIIPPEGWKPPFSLDPNTFKFPTRVQNLSRLGATARLSRDFEKQLRLFMFKRGTPLASSVTVDGQHVDLYRLYKAVVTRGGHDQMSKAVEAGGNVELWEEIAGAVGLPSSLGKALQAEYKAKLRPFEVYQDRVHKGLLPHDPDDPAYRGAAEVGENSEDAATSAKATRIKRPSRAATMNAAADPAAHSRSLVGRRFWRYFPDDDFHAEATVSTYNTERHRFTVRYEVKLDSSSASRKSRSATKAKAPAATKFSEVMIKKDLVVFLANGGSKEAAKAVHDSEFCEVCMRTNLHGPMSECYSCGALRHAPCMEPPLRALPRGDWFCPDCLAEDLHGEDSSGQACRSGHKGSSSASRMGGLCAKPPSNSYATPFTSLVLPYGYEDGSTYTLAEFKKEAHEWRAEFFMKRFGKKASEVTQAEVEKIFWSIVDGESQPVAKSGHSSSRGKSSRLSGAPREEDIKVEYGSELDSGTYGSAFPVAGAGARGGSAIKKEEWSGAAKGRPFTSRKEMALYEKSGWNINNLPVLSGSMLHHLDMPVSGVVVPWLYIGAALTAFCWHAEDHFLYSINYMHMGPGAKAWYSIPGSHADHFEAMVKELYPELMDNSPDLLLQLVTMINPKHIAARGIPVYRTVQRENEFIITFPQAFHGGFNYDFNIAEAVNFAPADFLPWGGKAQELYRRLRRNPVFSQDQLVVALARAQLARPARETAECHAFVVSELQRMRADLRRREDAARGLGVTRFDVDESVQWGLAADEDQDDIDAEKGRRGGMRSTRASLPSTPSTPVNGKGCGGRKGPRYVLLKGPKCAHCLQYCFLEQVMCSGACGAPSGRVVCGEHVEHACSVCPPSELVYRQRCPENILNNLLAKLGVRGQHIDAWKKRVAEVAACLEQHRVVTTQAPQQQPQQRPKSGKRQKTTAATPLTGGRFDPSGLAVLNLSDRAKNLMSILDPEGWATKPSYYELHELSKTGRDLGVPKAEMAPLEAALRHTKEQAEAIVSALPLGTARLGHMRLGQYHRQQLLLLQRVSGSSGSEVEDETSSTTTVHGGYSCFSMSLDRLIDIAVWALDQPIKLEKEAAAALRLLREVTRARRTAWELLGVKLADDFDTFESILRVAEGLMPACMSIAEGDSLLPCMTMSGSTPPAKQQPLKTGKKRSAGGGGLIPGAAPVVQGRWEGRRFSFIPTIELQRQVERLETYIKHMQVAVPEMTLLMKGYLIESEDRRDRFMDRDLPDVDVEENTDCISVQKKPKAKKRKEVESYVKCPPTPPVILSVEMQVVEMDVINV